MVIQSNGNAQLAVQFCVSAPVAIEVDIIGFFCAFPANLIQRYMLKKRYEVHLHI